MTKTEADRIDALAQEVGDLTSAVAGMAAELKGLRENTQLQVNHLQQLCNERHGDNVRRIAGVEQSERGTASFADKVKGAAVPISLCIAAIALILSAVNL